MNRPIAHKLFYDFVSKDIRYNAWNRKIINLFLDG